MNKIKIISLDNEILVIYLENNTIPYVNALRRIMISEVPTMAIDLIDVEINTTVMHDELIAHRLGLIPITSHKVNKMNYTIECDCDDFCNKCTVRMFIDVKQNQGGIREITANDIISSNPNFKPNDPDIIITKITQGQHLKLQATAKKGIGKKHAKWSPVCPATYFIVPEIKLKVSDTMSEEDKKEWIKHCPKNVFSYFDGIIDIEDVNNCDYCEECVEKSKEIEISVKEKRGKDDTRNFIFTIESTGSLKPEEIFKSAIEVLEEKLSRIKKKIMF